MEFRLVIDKTAEENITATVRERTRLTDKVEALVMAYNGSDSVTGFWEDEIKALYFADIECVFVESGKTYAVLKNGSKYIIKLRLYEIEKLLPTAFIKINKSAVGNMERIERFKGTLSGAVNAVFRCGHIEYVSRRCFAEIKRRLTK